MKNWFSAWLQVHVGRHALISLPSPEKAREMYAAWRVEFTAMGVTYEQADAASLELMKRGKHFKSEHFAMLVAVLAGKSGGANDARTEAERASADCPYCRGNGRTPVVDSEWGAQHAACCICPSGRFYLAAWSKQSRPLDLGLVLEGRTFRVYRRDVAYTVSFQLAVDPEECEHGPHLPTAAPRRIDDARRTYLRTLPLRQPPRTRPAAHPAPVRAGR